MTCWSSVTTVSSSNRHTRTFAYWALAAICLAIPLGEVQKSLVSGMSVAKLVVPMAFLWLCLAGRMVRVHPLTPWALVFVVLTLPSLLIGEAGFEVILTTMVGYLLLLQVVANATLTTGQVDRLILLLTMSLTGIAFLTLLAFATGWDCGVMFGTPLADPRWYPRTAGTEANPNAFGAHFIPAMMGVFHLMCRERSHLRRLAIAVMGLFLAAVLLLTVSRSAILGMSLAIGIYCWAVSRNRKATVMWVVPILVIVAMIAVAAPTWIVGLSGDQTSDYIFKDKEEAVAIRQDMVQVIWSTILEHPLVGIGYDRFTEVLRNNPRWPYEWSGNAHNLPAGIAIEYGLLALAVFLTMIGIALSRAWRTIQVAEPALRGTAAFLLAALCGVLTHSLFHYTLVNVTLWLLLGLAGSFVIPRAAAVRASAMR